MRWYEGSIAEAVNLSKQRDSVFVVYVDGNDEMSAKLRRFIDEEKIRSKLESEHFVAIKIDSGSESYMQFAQIYQLVPLPSIFFIGKNGAPIQVVTGVITTSDELEQKIKIVLETVGVKEIVASKKVEEEASASSVNKTQSAAASASQNFIANEQASDPNYEVVCEGDVCYRRPKKEETPSKPSPNDSNIDSLPSSSKLESNSTQDVKPDSTTPSVAAEPPPSSSPSLPSSSAPPAPAPVAAEPSSSTDDVAQRVEQAKKLIEEKRKQKEEEEKRLEREREIRRRKEGQEMLNFKKMQREQELQQMKENIRREKMEEQAARQRILEKIASDRAEQAKKFSSPEKPKTTTTETVQQPTPAPSSSLEFSRIQFRKPEGDTNTHTFKSSDQFQNIRDYVRTTLLVDSAIRDFSLAMTFPRREFTAEDDSKTLLDLGLCPSAVLLVIAGQRSANSPSAIVARSGGFVNMFNMVFWGLLSPFFVVFNYLRGWITGQRPDSTATTGAQKRANEESMADNDAAKRRNIDRLLNRNFVNDDPSASGSDKSKKDVPYRRVPGSNIHRLRESKDSDDENNTWNGNSTQQQ